MTDPISKVPTVVVDGLHVKYRVFASGKLEKRGIRRVPKTRGMREVHALKGVSFAVYEGESIGVIGHNGSGKSTLLRTIAGLTPASEGNVYASAQPALLGVNAALMPNLSGDKNVRLGALALGFSTAELDEKADEILAVDGLDAVFIGRGDLTAAYRDREAGTPRVRAATLKVMEAARRCNKPVFLLTANAKEAAEYAALGASGFVTGTDQGFMRAAATSALRDYQSALARK